MKYALLFAILLSFCFMVNAQSTGDSYADSRAMNVPMINSYSTLQLATYINYQFTNDQQKTRAAYRWVTANISYDTDSMLAINWNQNNAEKIAATLRRKKGVCDNFASVFADILLKMNIPSYTVHGFTNQFGLAGRAHSWTAVQQDNKWYLCDPTWDAGFINEPRFFLVSPHEFLATHWPFDPLWQLIPYPVTFPEFKKGLTAGTQKKEKYTLPDAINIFLSSDSLQQLEATTSRMRTNGLEQKQLHLWVEYNQMNIAIMYEENNRILYNAAVADANKANEFLNNFSHYRNEFFRPAKTDASLLAMLQPVHGFISEALKKVAAIGLKNNNFQYNTGLLRERLHALTKRLEENNLFLNLYLQAGTTEREKVFYK